MPLIGAHVSAMGGLWRSIEKGEEIGAEVIQIFGASPRAWQVRMPKDEEVQRFLKRLRESKIQGVYLHAPYLINLASSDERIRSGSLLALASHLKIAELVWAQGLIFHLGSGKEMPKEEAIENLASGMKNILKSIPGDSKLIMENSAGGGHRIGSTAHDLRVLLETINSDRVKVCFDTAHAFEAGIIDAYTPQRIRKLFDEWEKEMGTENIVAVHANDSKTAFNSHNDRHENIGAGYIGLEGFKNLAKERRILEKPWILEVPGFDGEGPDRKNIEILKSCLL